MQIEAIEVALACALAIGMIIGIAVGAIAAGRISREDDSDPGDLLLVQRCLSELAHDAAMTAWSADAKERTRTIKELQEDAEQILQLCFYTEQSALDLADGLRQNHDESKEKSDGDKTS